MNESLVLLGFDPCKYLDELMKKVGEISISTIANAIRGYVNGKIESFKHALGLDKKRPDKGDAVQIIKTTKQIGGNLHGRTGKVAKVVKLIGGSTYTIEFDPASARDDRPDADVEEPPETLTEQPSEPDKDLEPKKTEFYEFDLEVLEEDKDKQEEAGPTALEDLGAHAKIGYEAWRAWFITLYECE